MAAESRLRSAWEPRLLRWANLGLEAAVLYLVLAAWARPRTGPTGWLPAVACLALALGLAVRRILDETTVGEQLRWLATGLAAVAWSMLAAQLVAPPGYWQADAPRLQLLSGAILGGRDGSALQPLAFWSSLLLWWRGHSVSNWEPTLDDALGRLRLGGAAAAAAVGLAAVTDGRDGFPSVQLEQMLGVGVFFWAALTLTALSRRREMAGGITPAAAVAEPGSPGRSRAWLIAVLTIAVALAVLTLTVLGTGLFTPETLSPIFGLGGMLVQGLLSGLGTLAALVAALWSQIQLSTPTFPAAEPTAAMPGEAPAEPRVPPAALDVLGLLVWVVGGLGLLLLLGTAMFRMLSRISLGGLAAAQYEQEQEQPSGVPATTPVTVLARLLRLFRRFWSTPRSAAERVREGIAASTPMVETRTVRSVYREYLLWCRRQGHVRQTYETPDELGERVAIAFPELSGEIELLTSLYVASRYAGRTPSSTDLRQAQLAMSRLRRVQRDADSESGGHPGEGAVSGSSSPS